VQQRLDEVNEMWQHLIELMEYRSVVRVSAVSIFWPDFFVKASTWIELHFLGVKSRFNFV
jgi:hypothetical protein